MIEFLERFHLDPRKQSWLVFILGILAGTIGWKLYGNPSWAIWGDAGYYYRAALLIKADIGNLFTNPEIGVGESLNAIVLGILIKLPFNDFYEIFIFQILIYAFTGYILFRFAKDYLKSTAGAWLVFLFYAINNKHWQHIYILKPGVWVVFWIVVCLYFAFKLFKDPENRKLLILFALFVGLLVLTDMRYIPHLSFLTFMIYLPQMRFIKALGNMGLILGIVLLIITPWCLREYLVFNRFIFISDVNTIVIQRTFAPEKFKDSWVYEGEKLQQDSVWLPDGRNIQHEMLIQNGQLSREEVNRLVSRESAKPSWQRRLEYGFKLWSPFKFNYSYETLETLKPIVPPASLANNMNRIFTLGILYPFFFIGIYSIARKRDWFGWGLVGMLFFHFILHMLTYNVWRYLLPMLPVITIIAIIGLKLLFPRIFQADAGKN